MNRVSLVLVLAASSLELGQTRSPLAVVFRNHPLGGDAITLIGMFAGVNGALVQIVMASRVAYGLAKQGQAPRRFARVHPWTRTPVDATIVVSAVVLGLALCLPLESLAKITSGILLLVFALVNLSLWRIRNKLPALSRYQPRWLPLLGACLCTAFLVAQIFLAVFRSNPVGS